MKCLPSFIVFLSFLTGCSNTPVATSDSDTCQVVQNFDKKVSFNVDGFGGKNIPVDFNVRSSNLPFDPSDTLLYTTITRGGDQDGSFYYEIRAGMSYNVKIGEDNDYVKLQVIVPKMLSGEYNWDVSSMSGKNGVSFIRVAGGVDGGTYRPISGKTLIRFSFSTSDGKVDTVFGSFCGVMKNSFGEQLTVHEGKFFYIYP
jgi:hypothetical protein